MRTVNIAELKSHLSSYLCEVKGGEEILIRDRSVPIAKIVPLSSLADLDEEERALVALGKLRPPEQSLPESFFAMPAPRISARRVVAAVRADRDED